MPGLDPGILSQAAKMMAGMLPGHDDIGETNPVNFLWPSVSDAR